MIRVVRLLGIIRLVISLAAIGLCISLTIRLAISLTIRLLSRTRDRTNTHALISGLGASAFTAEIIC